MAINPPPILLPKSWMADPELKQLGLELTTIIRQLWDKTGGANDLTGAALSSSQFFDSSQDANESSSDAQFINIFEGDTVKGELSAGNTTISTLSGAATFTGTSEQNDYPDVMCSCFADVAGTLYFEFSDNGSDWRVDPANGFAVAAGVHEFHTAVKGSRFFRVRFVNDSSAQSVFQLYTYYGEYRQTTSPMNKALDLDADSIAVRSSKAGLDMARGLLKNQSVIHKFGFNDSIGTSYSVVALGGAYETPQAAGATALRIKSGGHANDTAAGTGAQEILLEGLDEDFLPASEALATNGASASLLTTTTFTRLFRASVSVSGSYASLTQNSHDGAVVIENGVGGTDWATINHDVFAFGRSEIAAFTVPKGFVGYIPWVSYSISSNKVATILGGYRENADQASTPYSSEKLFIRLGGITGSAHVTPPEPIGPFVGPCDMAFIAKVGTGSGEVDIDFEIILVKE